MPLFDEDTGNYLSQLLTSTGNMSPSYMQPSAPRQTYAPPMQQGPWQPGREAQSLDDIQRKAYYEAGVPMEANGQPQGQKRTSLVNILGGFADAFAELGGSKPMYQPSLDAATERSRQVEGDQMARDKFGLDKQKYGLDVRKTESDLLNDQNERLGQVAGVLRRAQASGNPELVRNIWGRLRGQMGMTDEQLAQADQEIAANPDAFVSAMEAFASGGDAAEYYGTQYYETDDQGNVYPYIIGKDGTKQYITPGNGRQAAPKLSIENTGLGYQGINPHTGRTGGPITPITAIPEQGVSIERNPDGTPRFTPIAGGKQDIELTKDVTDLRTLGNALNSYGSMFPDVRNNIDVMARSGSLSGVPEGTVGVDGQPITGGSNIGAIVQQNVPYVEQLTNDQGFSARQQIDSAGRTMVSQLGPLLTQAQNSGANLTSRMMDTPKELEGLLAQVINQKDYGAAVKAYGNFERRYNEVRREVQERIKAAEAKTARGRQQPSGDVQSISDDAGYAALPSGATFRAPDGSIRRKP